MPKATLTVWGEAECRRLHGATLELLEEVGVDVMHEPSLELYRAAGARVEGRRVRIPGRLVDTALASAPCSWLLRPRGGSTEPLDLRDGEVYFGTGSDVLYVRDPRSGERRRARRGDVEGMAALCEQLPNIDFVMSMGLPEDAPQAIDDLVQVVAMLRGTRKPLLVAPRDGSVLERMQQMATLCGEKESFAVYAMPSPPLMHDPDALTKVIGCALLRIPLIYAPAPAAGATGPCSIPGTVLVGNAEALSGLVLHQHVRAGAPFVYGAGGGAMDMRTMTDPYLAPDSAARPAGEHRPRPLLRPPELLLRGHVRLEGARRAVERRGGALHGLRLAVESDAAARCRLPRVRSAELLRVDRPRRRTLGVRAAVHARGAGG